MLRRSFLASSILSLLVSPKLLRSAPVVEREKFPLSDVPFGDLRRLRIYTLLDTGEKVEHKINWYGRIRFPHQWNVIVSDSLTLKAPAASIEKTYEIDGVVVGRMRGSFPDKLNVGQQDQITMNHDLSGVHEQNIFLVDKHPRHMEVIRAYLALTAKSAK